MRHHCNTKGVLAKVLPFVTILLLGLGITCPLSAGSWDQSPASNKAVDAAGFQSIAYFPTAGSLTRSPFPYQQGIKAYRQGHYQQALTLLNQAYQRDVNNPNIRYYLAITLDHLQQWEKACFHYEYVVNHLESSDAKQYAQSRLVQIQRVNTAQRDTHQELGLQGKAGQFWVPLSPHNNALMVEATINDNTSGLFIVDTGATYTSISKRMADELGNQLEVIGSVTVTTANGRIEVPKVRIKTITLNGLTAYNVEATVIDVRKSSSFSGLLGLSFLKQFKLTIDPNANRLLFETI